MEGWLSDDSPTPKAFCDLMIAECEQESRGEYEEQERICGACMITAREKQERKEKMKGRKVHWEDQIEEEDKIEKRGEESKDSSSGDKEKGIGRFLKGQNEERAEDGKEGSSGSKADEAGRIWYLKNGYMEDEDGDCEDDVYEEEEDLFVYEEEKYGDHSGSGQEKDTGFGRVLKNHKDGDDDDDLFFCEE